jgi:hypothetical protein
VNGHVDGGTQEVGKEHEVIDSVEKVMLGGQGDVIVPINRVTKPYGGDATDEGGIIPDNDGISVAGQKPDPSTHPEV